MRAAGEYYVYILASRKHGTLYIGVTNDLPKRLEQHRSGHGSEFVKKSSPRPHGSFRIAARCDRTWEAIEGMATRLEDSFGRRA
jgi:predicted GIY-YIG superfamily endonuclease